MLGRFRRSLVAMVCLGWCVFGAELSLAAANCEPDNPLREIPVSECNALMQIYNATDGANWLHYGKRPWDEDGPLCFNNVLCTEQDDALKHVTGLNLPNVGMAGTLPGSAFAKLPYLVRIDMRNNALTGPVPSELSDLLYLKELQLESNHLSGTVPEELLGNQDIPGPSTVEMLNLADNQLSGPLPQSIGRDSIAYLKVHRNQQMDGAIPSQYLLLDKLVSFSFYATAICEPGDQPMQDWLDTVSDKLRTSLACGATDPTVPGAIVAKNGNDKTPIKITWGAASVADYYELERAAATGQPLVWTRIGRPADPAFNDSGHANEAESCVSYHYRVRSCNYDFSCSNYVSTQSNDPAVKTMMIGSPQNLSLNAYDGGTGDLRFDAVDKADSYYVYRAKGTRHEKVFSDEKFALVVTISGGPRLVRIFGTGRKDHAVIACRNGFTCCGAAALWRHSDPSILPVLHPLFWD